MKASADENLGASVDISADGSVIAFSASHDLDGSTVSAVKTYSWNGDAWTQIGDSLVGEASAGIALLNSGTEMAISREVPPNFST